MIWGRSDTKRPIMQLRSDQLSNRFGLTVLWPLRHASIRAYDDDPSFLVFEHPCRSPAEIQCKLALGFPTEAAFPRGCARGCCGVGNKTGGALLRPLTYNITRCTRRNPASGRAKQHHEAMH